MYDINSYCISQHNLLLPVSDSFHTYNYGLVFIMARTIGFCPSDDYTVLIFICLSREVWRQFQLVSHDLFVWPSSFCLNSWSTFQSAAPWLPLLYLGFVYCGFGCKHRNGVWKSRRWNRQDRVFRTKCIENDSVHYTTSATTVAKNRRSRWFTRKWGRKRDCFRVVFSHGRPSVRWNRDDRHRVRRKRARPWDTQSIQYNHDCIGLPQHVGITLANGRKKFIEEVWKIRFRSALYRSIVQIVW